MTDRRTGRYRGLRAHPENLGVRPCGPGEASAVARVRGRSEMVEWWLSLTPAWRGQLLEWLHEQVKAGARST